MIRKLVLLIFLMNTVLLCAYIKGQDTATATIKNDEIDTENHEDVVYEEEETPEGDFIYIEGNVWIMEKGTEEWKKVDDKTKVPVGSEIKLESNSYAQFNMDPNKEVELSEQTMVTVAKKGSNASLELIFGSLKAKIKKLPGEQMEIRTPVAVAAVRGTEFAVVYEEKDSAEVEVYDGAVEVRNIPEKGKPFSVTVEKDNWAKIRSRVRPELMGKITEKRELKWKHFKNKKELFLNIRKLKRLRMRNIRLEKMYRIMPDPEKKEKLKIELEKLSAKKETVKNELKNNREVLKKIVVRYKKLRKEKTKIRKAFIDERRREIMKSRKKIIKERLKERRKKIRR